MRKHRKAFTLIELLIVVLIIAILAAIAIPNFMEFQTRAKISRVKSDMRTMATGLEAYCVDYGTYPAVRYSEVPFTWFAYESALTTPIAYLTSVPKDPFMDQNPDGDWKIQYEYGAGKDGPPGVGYAWDEGGPGVYMNDTWLLDGSGPDGISETRGITGTSNYPWMGINPTPAHLDLLVALVYDPTNGTVSLGQIQRVGGAPLTQWPKTVWSQLVTR